MRKRSPKRSIECSIRVAIDQIDADADNAHPAVILHRAEHFAHRRLDPDEDGAGDDGVADVQLDEVRDLVDQERYCGS